MNELMRIFEPATSTQRFDQIQISIASPERIGPVFWGNKNRRPSTTELLPERDGLFCARIFGPIKDYECLCGKYKRMKYMGIVCENVVSKLN